MSFNLGPVGPSRQRSKGHEGTWGPYWDWLFPPLKKVSAFVDWKRGSSGVNVARRLWDQREYFRRTYESVYGTDPALWPSRHPGVVLDAVRYVTHSACLGCQWIGAGGYLAARRHEMGADA